MSGTVVTFYSYKGGVGRSFALANIATLLGRWGFRVLCIDWDLEAPGLAHFFRPPHDEPSTRQRRLDDRPGITELVSEFKKTKQTPLNWRPYVQILDAERTPGVSLIVSGKSDPSYTRRLRSIKWDTLYKSGLGDALEIMFEELRAEYDFILIDARTGITDFSGIITAQLPDILAFMFTANEQSFDGATSVARRAVDARNNLAIDRSRLLLLPIPARFEIQLEHQISQRWRERFAADLADFYKNWAAKDAPSERLVQATTIPYVPFWSFGERLSVVEDAFPDPLSINYSLETLAALLAHKLGRTGLLLESRDEFVDAARRLPSKERAPLSFFLSYSHNDRRDAVALAQSLERRGARVFLEDAAAQYGSMLTASNEDKLSQSQHMVALLGNDTWSHWRDRELRSFLRQAASDEDFRLFLPFLLTEAVPGEIPSHLRQYNFGHYTDPESAADEVLKRVAPRPTSPTEPSRLRVRISAEGGTQVADASICAIASNGTTINARSEQDGKAELNLVEGRSYTLLVAHPQHPARVIKDFSAGDPLHVRLEIRPRVGSAILHSTGHLPGLEGRLSPILDTHSRTYLYADNIAIDGGSTQPVAFAVGKPIELEDAQGRRFQATVKYIAGRTSLLEYFPLN